MDIKELIVGTFEDYWNRFDKALEGLASEELAWRPQATHEPGTHVIRLHWDGMCEEFIAGEHTEDASP